MSPFDVLRHLNEKTELEFDLKKDYVPWVINKALINTKDTVFFAEVMNKYHFLDKDIQYTFYKFGIPKAKRFGKWVKADAINTDVELIMNRYQVSRRTAETYRRLMGDENLKQLQEQTGGYNGTRCKNIT